MNRAILSAIAILVLSMGAAAQQGGGQVDRDVTNRINASLKQLEADDKNSNLSDRQLDDNRDRHTRAIRNEVTRLIENKVRPSDLAPAVEARLRALLAAQEVDAEISDVATARISDLRYGRSLVVTYTVQRPPHHDTAMIYAFHDDSGKYRLTASTGEDFDGYSMFTRQVASPDPKVMYLLAGGQAFGFNGARFQFRLYAFDGSTFTTLWQPDDVFNAKVRVTARGFSISYSEKPMMDTETANYETTVNGVVKVQ